MKRERRGRDWRVEGEGKEAGSRAKRIFWVVCVDGGGETSWERMAEGIRSSAEESIHVWRCVCSRTVDSCLLSMVTWAQGF